MSLVEALLFLQMARAAAARGRALKGRGGAAGRPRPEFGDVASTARRGAAAAAGRRADAERHCLRCPSRRRGRSGSRAPRPNSIASDPRRGAAAAAAPPHGRRTALSRTPRRGAAAAAGRRAGAERHCLGPPSRRRDRGGAAAGAPVESARRRLRLDEEAHGARHARGHVHRVPALRAVRRAHPAPRPRGHAPRRARVHGRATRRPRVRHGRDRAHRAARAPAAPRALLRARLDRGRELCRRRDAAAPRGNLPASNFAKISTGRSGTLGRARRAKRS